MGETRENVKRALGYYLSLRGMTQKELAEKLNVSQSAVTNWIKGNNSPDIDMVALICEILDVSVIDLFGISGEGQFSDEEKEIIAQYRKKIEFQQAIKILLDIPMRN